MLHLENFFEKSFALLLTTPSEKILRMFSLTKKKHESRTYTGELKKYRFDVMPDETDYYEFPNEEKNSLLLVNADECQIYPLFCYISGFSLDKEENYE